MLTLIMGPLEVHFILHSKKSFSYPFSYPFGLRVRIGEDFEKTVKLLAREAASGDVGMSISPLVNTDRKGGAYPIMLQQFR